MRITVSLCLLLILSFSGELFVTAAQTASSDRSCKIKSIVGSAKIRRNSTVNWLDARINMPLKERDAIRTMIETEVELETSEGTIIKIGENSTMELGKLSKKESTENTTVKIMNGSLAANVKKLVNNQSTFEFETPTATAAIRGTIVGFEVNKEKTIVKVYEGKVLVTPEGSRNGSEIKENQMASVVKGQKNVVVEKLTEKTPPLLPAPKGESSGKDSSKVVTDTLLNKSSDSVMVIPDSTNVKSDSVKGDSIPVTPVKKDTIIKAPAVDTAGYGLKQKSTINTDSITVAKKATLKTTSAVDSSMIVSKTSTTSSSSAAAVTPVRLVVSAPGDGGTVKPGSAISVSGTVTPSQTKVTVNGKQVLVSSGTFKTTITAPSQDGQFEISITGENGSSSQNVTRTVNVKQTQLQFSITSPIEGQVFKKTTIAVSGTATPGAEVTVMSIKIPVSSSGTFSGQIPIPNEDGDVYIEFEASLDGKFQNVTRKIRYEPEYRFTLLTPQDGQEVNSTTIQVRGEVLPVTSKVTVLGRSLVVSSTGIFTGTVTIPDEEGQVELDFEISSGIMVKNETKKITYKKPPDIARPEVRGVLPTISELEKIPVTVFDRTPDDEVTLWIDIDGTKESEKGAPNSNFTVTLQPGIHKYTLYAVDKAGNQSAVLTQSVAWFGQTDWVIKTQKTSEVLHLPPSGPANDYEPVYTTEFSIENLPDNNMKLIGSVTVINRVTGESIVRKTFTDTYFSIDMKLKNHTVNIIDVIVEDIRNSVKTKTITLTIK